MEIREAKSEERRVRFRDINSGEAFEWGMNLGWGTNLWIKTQDILGCNATCLEDGRLAIFKDQELVTPVHAYIQMCEP